MDPDATLTHIREAIASGDAAQAAALFEYLDQWLSKDGFVPADWRNDLERQGKHWAGSDRIPRMTNAQRDRLWVMCGNYGVAFNERDYAVSPLDASMMPGWVQGMVGGNDANTIFTGVSPEGRSHT